ncbi:Uncharacterized protein GBIM_13780 [Gryllus bimaculatus]|nr:Uncharacterized protein GBIM_13780 [Gryllus bimaculatus]
MSKFNLPSGIILSCDQNGLLTVAEEHLENLMKKDPLSNIYIVEHTPFARGKFAAVRKCTHRETGVEYAAKFIRKRRRAMDQRADILHEPQNLLLTGNYPDCDVKLCDFGISRVIQNGVEVREILGTPDYVGLLVFWLMYWYQDSPHLEVIQNKKHF